MDVECQDLFKAGLVWSSTNLLLLQSFFGQSVALTSLHVLVMYSSRKKSAEASKLNKGFIYFLFLPHETSESVFSDYLCRECHMILTQGCRRLEPITAVIGQEAGSPGGNPGSHKHTSSAPAGPDPDPYHSANHCATVPPFIKYRL